MRVLRSSLMRYAEAHSLFAAFLYSGPQLNSVNPANSANMRTVNKHRIKIVSSNVTTTRTARTHCGVYCGFVFTVQTPQYKNQHFSSEKKPVFQHRQNANCCEPTTVEGLQLRDSSEKQKTKSRKVSTAHVLRLSWPIGPSCTLSNENEQ